MPSTQGVFRSAPKLGSRCSVSEDTYLAHEALEQGATGKVLIDLG
ncbi:MULTISPECIES: hypothetical protein [Streptomyces]|nr:MULTISPECIES: hypothetical protein [Streptomyces]